MCVCACVCFVCVCVLPAPSMLQVARRSGGPLHCSGTALRTWGAGGQGLYPRQPLGLARLRRGLGTRAAGHKALPELDRFWRPDRPLPERQPAAGLAPCLQADVEQVLKPRFAFFTGVLGLPQVGELACRRRAAISGRAGAATRDCPAVQPQTCSHARWRCCIVRRCTGCPARPLLLAQVDIAALFRPCLATCSPRQPPNGRPRFLPMLLPGCAQERAVTGVLRCPEALGIDTSLLAARAAFLQEGLGMSRQEVGRRGGGPAVGGTAQLCGYPAARPAPLGPWRQCQAGPGCARHRSVLLRADRLQGTKHQLPALLPACLPAGGRPVCSRADGAAGLAAAAAGDSGLAQVGCGLGGTQRCWAWVTFGNGLLAYWRGVAGANARRSAPEPTSIRHALPAHQRANHGCKAPPGAAGRSWGWSPPCCTRWWPRGAPSSTRWPRCRWGRAVGWAESAVQPPG